jgi:hypothetical protein
VATSLEIAQGAGQQYSGYRVTVGTGGTTLTKVVAAFRQATPGSVDANYFNVRAVVGGAVVAGSTVAFNITKSGYYEASFASPLTLAAGSYYFMMLTPNYYNYTSAPPVDFPFNWGANYTVDAASGHWRLWEPTDAVPTHTAGGENYRTFQPM